MSTHGPWQGVSLLSLLMALAGYFYVLYGVGIIIKRLANSSGPRRPGASKFFRTGMGSTSLSTERVRTVPMIVTAMCCLALITVPATIALAKYLSRYPTYEIGDDDNLVQVLRYDTVSEKWEFHYKGIDFWMKLCEKPPFDPGDYLKLYKYEDRGACASLDGEWTAVLIRRNEHGQTDSEVNKP